MLIYDQLWRILEYSCLFGPTFFQRLSCFFYGLDVYALRCNALQRIYVCLMGRSIALFLAITWTAQPPKTVFLTLFLSEREP